MSKDINKLLINFSPIVVGIVSMPFVGLEMGALIILILVPVLAESMYIRMFGFLIFSVFATFTFLGSLVFLMEPIGLRPLVLIVPVLGIMNIVNIYKRRFISRERTKFEIISLFFMLVLLALHMFVIA